MQVICAFYSTVYSTTENISRLQKLFLMKKAKDIIYCPFCKLSLRVNGLFGPGHRNCSNCIHEPSDNLSFILWLDQDQEILGWRVNDLQSSQSHQKTFIFIKSRWETIEGIYLELDLDNIIESARNHVQTIRKYLNFK